MMIKALLVVLALVVLYKLFTNDKTRKNKEDVKERERKVASGEMVKDPMCGSYVEVQGSLTVKDGNKTIHFCSYDCRERFLRELEQSGRAIPERNSDDD